MRGANAGAQAQALRQGRRQDGQADFGTRLFDELKGTHDFGGKTIEIRHLSSKNGQKTGGFSMGLARGFMPSRDLPVASS